MNWRNCLEAFLGLLYPAERSCLACREPLPEAEPARRSGCEARQPAMSAARRTEFGSGAAGRRNPERGWLSETELCDRCRSGLVPIEPPCCLLCGRHVERPGRCPECDRTSSFVLSRSFGKYEGILRELLHRFKFSREQELAPVLGFCLTQAWDLHFSQLPIDFLVPVPVHAERLKERGYNQAERLARHLSSYSSIPCLTALQRNRHMKGQASRDRKERLQALEGAYACDPALRDLVSGRRILLVDDIYTTGATAEACSQALLEGGAGEVYVITVAR